MTYSIIIPTYNSAKVIKCCLDSIIAQTYENFEVLVMDGCSKDDTVQIANSFKDDRIKVYSEADKGIYDAMNKGIDKSTGDWLLFLGSDDYLLNKDVLKTVSRYLQKEFDVVYGDAESSLNEYHRGEWIIQNVGFNRCHQAIFYNRMFFGKDIRYDLRYAILADYEINLRWFLMTKKYRHKFIPVVVSHFSMEGVSAQYKDHAFLEDYGKILLKYGKYSLTPKYKKRAWRSTLEYCKNRPVEAIKCRMHILYYWVLQKIQEFFKINQDIVYE